MSDSDGATTKGSFLCSEPGSRFRWLTCEPCANSESQLDFGPTPSGDLSYDVTTGEVPVPYWQDTSSAAIEDGSGFFGGSGALTASPLSALPPRGPFSGKRVNGPSPFTTACQDSSSVFLDQRSRSLVAVPGPQQVCYSQPMHATPMQMRDTSLERQRLQQTPPSMQFALATAQPPQQRQTAPVFQHAPTQQLVSQPRSRTPTPGPPVRPLVPAVARSQPFNPPAQHHSNATSSTAFALQQHYAGAWPQEVLKHLEQVNELERKLADTTLPSIPPAMRGLRLVAGACQIPHPKKVDRGGEDSYQISQSGNSLGVSDGVGEWEWRFQVNPRLLADEVIQGACAVAERSRLDHFSRSVDRAATALVEAYAGARSIGAATACLAVLDTQGADLGVANLGDSGCRQLRKGFAGTAGNGSAAVPFALRSQVVQRTREQTHFFNCPFQLARLPGPAEYPALIAQGKGELVKALQNGPEFVNDSPDKADLYSFPLQEGDLIVLGSDGLFDNLHEHELCELVDLTISPFEARQAFNEGVGALRGLENSTDPGSIAAAIAHAAFHRAGDKAADTPFAMGARENGFSHAGGKMDDITVVVAWAVRVGI